MPKGKRKSGRINTWLVSTGVAATAFVISTVIYLAIRHGAPSPPPRFKITVWQDTVVYSKASSDREVIGRVENEQAFTLVGRDPSGKWLQIEYGDQIGWINALSPDAYSMIFDLPVTGGDLWGRHKVKGIPIKLFTAPDINSESVSSLYYGDEFLFAGLHKNHKWAFIQSGDKQGWVAIGKDLKDSMGEKLKVAFDNLPLITEEHANVLMGLATPAPPP